MSMLLAINLQTFLLFPDQLELDKYGFKLVHPKISISHFFPNDKKYVAMYRSIAQTVKSIEKFSVKDAKAWIKLYNEYLLNRYSIINTINSTCFSNCKRN
jgi:phytoene dehydrogenase-like protein